MIVEIVRQKIKVGTVLQNPSKGNSIVEKYTEGSIRYKRGKSSIYLKNSLIESAYKNFVGKKVSTKDLANFDIYFSSKRHHCNATFFLMLMDYCGFSKSGIHGAGKTGNPFYIDLI